MSDVAPGISPIIGEEIPEGIRAGGCREGNDTSGENATAVNDPINLSYGFTFLDENWGYPTYDSIGLYWEWPWDNSTVLEFQISYGICSCELTYINSTKGDEPYYIRDYLTWYEDAENAFSYYNRFFVQVIALNGTGTSTSSAIVEILKPYHGRPYITDLTAPPGEGYVAITWELAEYENVEGPVEYRLYRYPRHYDREAVYIATVDVNTTHWVDHDVQLGEGYGYSVEAVYPDGVTKSDSESSIISSAWPEEALNGTAGTGAVSLTWEEPYSGPGYTPASYHIFRTTSYYSLYPDHYFAYPYSQDENHLVELEPGITEYTDENFTSEAILHYAVMVVYEDGVHELSNRLEIQPMLGVPVMDGFWRISTNDREGEISLEWDHATVNQDHPVSNYRIYRGSQEDDLKLIAEVEPYSHRYTDKDVGHKRTYYYQITAVNDIGESEPTQTRDVYVGKEEDAYNLQDLTPICCFGGILAAIILIIFLSGYVVGGWREVRKYRRKHENGDEQGGKGEEEPPREDAPDKRKDEDKRKTIQIPHGPQSRNR